MELPTEVLIHNEILGVKGGKGTLLQSQPRGLLRDQLQFGERLHRTLLPIVNTVLIRRARGGLDLQPGDRALRLLRAPSPGPWSG